MVYISNSKIYGREYGSGMTENEAIELLNIHKSTLEKGGYVGGKDAALEYDIAVKALEEIQQYRAIGTVEECREARERQRGKKPVCRSIFTDGTRFPGCPTCFSRIDRGAFYCSGCGQKLDWSE